jgi:hypothetical protein
MPDTVFLGFAAFAAVLLATLCTARAEEISEEVVGRQRSRLAQVASGQITKSAPEELYTGTQEA